MFARFINVPFVTTRRVVDIINNQPWNNKMVNTSAGENYDFSYKLNGGIKDDSLYFLLVKTEFNVLAYKKGQEFVLSSCFNDIRSKIISNTALCLDHNLSITTHCSRYQSVNISPQ